MVGSTVEPQSLQWDRYELLKKLGQGGKGIVYRARDRSLDRVVAVNLLKSEALAPAGYARFLRRRSSRCGRSTRRSSSLRR